ncbi:FHA (fork head associated) domain family protein [Babesia bovis T2Bo]|uniref:FHA (fork head associated) domain family protein n=1 Tax=Babesia bovis T2Bo TaxID=484906 RepID=UPI001C358B45|nr:FHA (fork head associated) domain family protein [Babesia bovis T2Bo]EDO08699.2 FHA (fork head associated) domain family protein [Babesia bovis T2Bo]
MRDRSRSPIRIKRESPESRGSHRRESYGREHLVRVKEELGARPIRIDSRGRPYKDEDRPRSKKSGSAIVIEPEKENFEPSGLLAAETNTRNGVVMKYTPPPESRMSPVSWRLYVFKPDPEDPKNTQVLKTIMLDKQEYYLIGCDQRVADIQLFHPTISKQHAVIQHRLQDNKRVRPYLIDLESTNGSFINGERIEKSRYYELKENDILKFGFSSREYVVLHDKCV